MLAKAARLEVDSRARNLAVVRIRKQNASDGFRQPPVPETVTEKANHQCRKPSPQSVSETVTTSISRKGPPKPPSITTPEAAALPKLVWTKPVVRELFGEEKRVRLAEVG